MTERYDTVIKGGNVWLPGGLAQVDIGIRSQRIESLGDLSLSYAEESFDATGLTVLPGVIDTQVHFREPGLEHKEDLESGSRGAALGGVVAVFEMPNTNPPTTSPEAIADKIGRASGRSWVDFAFFAGASPNNLDILKDLEMLPGVSGIKMFIGSSTGNLLVRDDATISEVLKNGVRRVAIHCEDEDRLESRLELVKNGADVAMHAEWRDVKTALNATMRIISIAREVKRPVHILHVTTAEEMLFLKKHKDIATVEVLPQHLTFSAPDAYERLGTLAQMNPPIREAYHRVALWDAVTGGLVDCIGSDHAPHTLEEKQLPYPKSPSGLTGVQTLVPVMLDHVHSGRLSLQQFVDLTSAGPARVYGTARKGRIALGYDADFTIVDLDAEREIRNDWIASKSAWTPYHGQKVTGWPIATIIRGNTVMREDELIGSAQGEPVRFVATL